MNFVKAMTIAQVGYDTWAAKPHNKKWAKMIYHTPIPNDLLVNIAEAFCSNIKPKLQERKTVFLIERKDNALFSQPHWYHEEPSGYHWWTPDAGQAKQFNSKAEVEAFRPYKLIASDFDISITEHVFVEGVK